MQTIVLEMERLRNPYSGLGQYCLQLGRALAAQQPEGLGFVGFVPKGSEGVFGEGVSYRQVSAWHKLFPPQLGASLWHCTHQDSVYLPGSRKTKLAITIHDLNYLDRPDYTESKKRRRLKVMQTKIDRADGLVYISNYVRQWVHQHLKVPQGMVERVIYNGGVSKQGMEGELKPAPILSNAVQNTPYLFSIGIHPKKNYHVLLPVLNAFKGYRWVIAGPDSKGYRGELEREAARLGVSDRVEFCGPVGETEKNELYAHCSALLFPSLSEGFGLPVIEAMSFGKPVFLSDRTCLPEIGGREAYYFTGFEPDKVIEEFATGMEDFKRDPEKPTRLKDWAAQFTWEKAASQYIEFYQAILDTNKKTGAH